MSVDPASEVASIVELHSAGTSVILELTGGGAPLWRYWGPCIEAPAEAWAPLSVARTTPTFAPDTDQPLSVFPTFGGAWFHHSALLAHRDGRDFQQDFQSTAVEWIEPGRSVRLRMVDTVAALEVEVRVALDASSDALTMSTAVTNTGTTLLDVQWLAAGVLPLPAGVDVVRSFAGRHLDEFHPLSDRLSRSGWRRENRRGLTSHGGFPGAVVAMPGTGRDAGLAFGAQLAWSGNHAQQIEWLDDGRFQWLLGEWLAPGEIRLRPGETFASPDVVAVCSDRGLNGVAQGFHAATRARLRWPGGAMRPRPVSLNTWEGFYFRHDLEELKQLADAAARLGVERFVLDDGWFRGRDDDTAGLGDWTPHPGKYPNGLGPLIDHVTGLGLEFGLWVEPEMVNPDSDLLRDHPDWALEVAGRPRITARNQLVLDLSRPEVSDYLFSAIDTLLTAHPIAYLKWDHNRDLATAGGADGRARYHRQVTAAYALMERLRSAHPGLEIEACAGGGGRIDMGVLRHTHRVWTSDNIDAVSRLPIQRGFLQFFPPEIMGAHVGADPAHTTGRGQSLDFRASVALPGHFGIEFDLRRLGEADSRRLADWIVLYKSLRGVTHGGRVWVGEGQDGLIWQAHSTDDESEFVVFIYRVDPQTQAHASPVRLSMLDAAAAYDLERLTLRRDGPRNEPSVRATGALLAAIGWTPPRMKAERCEILRLRRV